MSWDDAREYIKRLSAKTGQRYSLPSEAQWEYAARGGTSTTWSFGDNESDLVNYAWYEKNSGGKTQAVAQKRPNAYGLYDMHGNVWEWTEDCWHNNYAGAPSDGSAWTTNCTYTSARVLRGGSWYFNPLNLRAANRGRSSSDFRGTNFGFRVARTVSP